MRFLQFRKAKKPRKEPARLPGEKHPFRDLTPAQHLQGSQITSSRPQEVTREDPLLYKIRRLEQALQLIASQTDDHQIHRIIAEVLK